MIIPVFNAAPYLERSLSALLLNDLSNVEILVVNDASTDHSTQIVNSFRPSSPIVLVENPSRLGPAGSRNRGVAVSTSPHLLFLDSDVVLPARSIEWMRETLELYSHRRDIAGVLGCYSETVPYEDFLTNYKNLSTTYLYTITETQSPFLHTAICLLERKLLEESGGFDPTLSKAEDFRLGLRLGSRGFRFVIDRRISGIHLKRYTLFGLLREDWARIRALQGSVVSKAERRFSYRAHRTSRLVSLLIPGPALLLLLSILWDPSLVGLAGLFLLLFALINLPFYSYLRKHRGRVFALMSLVAFFFEMLWAEAALAAGLAHRRRAKVQNGSELGSLPDGS